MIKIEHVRAKRSFGHFWPNFPGFLAGIMATFPTVFHVLLLTIIEYYEKLRMGPKEVLACDAYCALYWQDAGGVNFWPFWQNFGHNYGHNRIGIVLF